MFPDAPRLDRLQTDLAGDLVLFAPELCVGTGVVLVLLARILPGVRGWHHAPLATLAAGAGLAFCVSNWPAADREAFAGLVRFDRFGTVLRGLVLVAAVLVLLLTRITRRPAADDSADFAALLLGGTLGMMLMATANHLLMVFLAVEMASLPSYALAGFQKGRGRAGEAALKYVVYGAAAGGVMLYGISLLAGRFGTGLVPAVAHGYAAVLRDGGWDAPLAAGTFFLLVGLGFKLAAVPFHLWLPDVFDGAAAEVGAFLSVASKAAAVGLTVRLLIALHRGTSEVDPTLAPRTLGAAVAVVAALTATLGNLAALAQTNLKRMLGYSTVAHAGYMLMAVACLNAPGVGAVLYYLGAYLLMNLGAFAVVALVRDATGSEDVSACRGLIRRSPAVGVCLAVSLLSLLGLPPLAGFAGKFQVFQAVYATGAGYAGEVPWLGGLFYALLGVGVLNTVASAGYYLMVLKSAGLDDPPADEKGNPLPLGEPAAGRAYLLLLAAGLVAGGVAWGPVLGVVRRAAGAL
jgi:NADH-quinone oxidoreductase subunit N